MYKKYIAVFMIMVVLLNLKVLPVYAADANSVVSTTDESVRKVTAYAIQLKNASTVNVTTGRMGWDTEKKPYSWAYFNGLMLDAFMMMDPSGSRSYVEGFYRANIDSSGKIINLENGKPPKGAVDNYEAMRAAFDLLPGSREANRICLGIQELYNQLEVMTTYSDCGGNYVHKQDADGSPSPEWSAFPIALDGLYMAQPYLMECANAIDLGNLTLKNSKGRTVTSESLYSAVYNRFTWIYNNLYNPSTGLYDHGYNPSGNYTNGITWSRSIGWYAMALVDVIEMMPSGTRKSNLIAELPRILDGMLRYQDQETGLWYNVTAYDSSLSGNRLETSGSAMMAYTIFKAYVNGWISDSKYAEAGLKAFNGIVANKMSGLSGNYSVIDTYRSSGVSTSASYYTTAPYTTNEAKGVGSLIMAATMANQAAEKYASALEEEEKENTESENTEESGSTESGDTPESGGNTEESGNGSENTGEGAGNGDIIIEDPLSITIHDISGTAANDFEAYQIFSGILTDSSDISHNIAWGEGIQTEDGKLKIGDVSYTALELVRAYTDGTITVDEMINAIEANLSENCQTGHAEDNYADATITVPAPGYYFVRNAGGSTNYSEAYTRFILRVVGAESIHVDAKTSAPFVDKKVKNQGEPVESYRDANNGKIGDVVNYRISSNVPDLTAYEEYEFIIHDTMSPGLTYQEGSLIVTLSDRILDPQDDYIFEISDSQTGETSISISFNNFIQYKEQTGSKITITYNAAINDQAIIGRVGNPNSVYLTYSNDPNPSGHGLMGETRKDWVKTYITRLMGYKFDGSDGKPLAGVEFNIKGFQEKCYTTDEGGNLQQAEINRTLLSDVNGFIDFESLGAGTYYITEIKTISGYNLLKDDIEIVISCDSDEKTIYDGTEPTVWEVTANGAMLSDMLESDHVEMSVDPAMFIIGIENERGIFLPATGGPGTHGFYTTGILLLLISLLLMKKRL